jgi:hypothetical protein
MLTNPKERVDVKTANTMKAISKILLILLLLLATIIGSIFSYLLLAGYYINLETRVPENTIISVLSANLDPQNTQILNITILNPTYSPTEAKIKEISIATNDNTLHKPSNTNPQLPYTLNKGQDQTFICTWNWEEYAGQTIKIIVLVEDGSGAAYEVETEFINLLVTGTIFETADSQHLNVTVSNHDDSIIDLDITRIAVTMDNGSIFEVTEIAPTLPQLLPPDTSLDFRCTWDWTTYRGRNATITVTTEQGYTAQRTETTPKAVQLSISDTNFDTSNMTIFSITVSNSENSIASANLTTVELLFSDQTTLEVPTETPSLPYQLSIGESVSLTVVWDWSEKRGENVAIEIKTPEEYFGITQVLIP